MTLVAGKNARVHQYTEKRDLICLTNCINDGHFWNKSRFIGQLYNSFVVVYDQIASLLSKWCPVCLYVILLKYFVMWFNVNTYQWNIKSIHLLVM